MIKEYFNPWKVLIHENKINQILEGRIPKPVAVEIDPANACNLKCPWCFYDKVRQTHKEIMPREQMENLIQDLIHNDINSITFTGGGEPLVNTNTVDMIEIYGNEIDMAMVTNGVLINKNNVKILVKNLKYIRISLDAFEPDTYKKMKGVDKLQTVLKNIMLLVKTRDKLNPEMQIGIAFIIHKDNWTEVHLATKAMKKMGVDYITIRPVLDSKNNIMFPKDNYTDMLTEVSYAELEETDNFRVYANTRRMEEVATGKKNFKTCKSTPLIAIVSANQHIYLCCQTRLLKPFEIGKINYPNTGFFDLWNTGKHKDIIDKINVSKCAACRNGRYNEIIESVFEEDYMHRSFI